MRTLSTTFNEQTTKQQTTAVFLTLITLSFGEEGDETILRFVNNITEIESDGNTYLPLGFTFVMPQDGEESRSASIVLDNVDRRLSEFILSASVENIYLNEKLIEASTPDNIELERDYVLRNINITRQTVKAELKYLEYLDDAFPKLRKLPKDFPGLF